MAIDTSSLDGIIDRIDAFVKPFYKAEAVSKIESSSFYASLTAMEWHQKVTEALRNHFEILTKIGGILSIVFGTLGILAALGGIGIISMFGPGYAMYLGLSLVVSVILCGIGIISGFGLLGKKAWIPFLAVVQFALSLGSQLIFKFAEAFIPKTTTLYVFGMQMSTTTEVTPITVWWMISFCISVALGFIGLSFVIRLKDMFGKREIK